jgi:hypothetical protein
MSKVGAFFLAAFCLWTGAWLGGFCEAENLGEVASHGADFWAAVGAGLSAIATAALVVVGAWQISSARNERKGWETLKACERYDSDLVLDNCSRILKMARDSGDLAANPRKYTLDVIALLNYLEGIAAGIEQDLYVESIAKDHMQSVVNGLLERYVYSPLGAGLGISEEDYSSLVSLDRKWQR